MARHILVALFALAFVASVRAEDTRPQNQHDLSIAIEEMQRANYFSFVMLINMLPSVDPRFLANVTFLMPKDKTLSRAHIQEDSVSEFLLRHSIPSPLLFEHLNLFPNGSTIPSSLADYSLEISNGGRLNYHLNNAKIISRNICSLGSIKCHGIDDILSLATDDSPQSNHTIPSASCPSSSSSSSNSSGYVPPPSFPPTMAPSPSSEDPTHPRKSESSKPMLNAIFTLLLGLGSCVMKM